MSLRPWLDKARSWLGAAPPKPEVSEQAIRQTRFDEALFTEMREEAPVLNEVISSLNRDYGYTEELVGDTFAHLYQSAPIIRPRTEMAEPCLPNQAVATNLAKAPDFAALRGYSRHDKYAATMGAVSVTNKVRQLLAQEKDLQEAAKAAEQARQETEQQDQQVQQAADQAEAQQQDLDALQQALQDAQAAADAAQEAAAAAMGGFDGNGPLTQDQADAQDAATDAAIARDEAQAALDAGTQSAELTAQQLADLLMQAELSREAAQAASEQVQAEATRVERASRAAVADGVHQAVEDLEEERALFRAWGFGDGDLERMSFQERAAKARRMRGHKMSEFTLELGRWKTMQKVQYAKKVADARDEVYDVTNTGHLPDVLPSEFAHLGTEPGKVEFLSRLAEGKLLGLKYRGTEQIGQGAIIALVDTSGSMKTAGPGGSTREVFAKGMALALLDQARAEKRDFVGIIFGNASKQKVWHFPMGHGDFDDVLDFAEEFFSGGTDFQVPMDLAMNILDKEFNTEGKAKADIVLITDDDCAVTPEWLAAYQTRKTKLDFRTFGIAVGMPRAGGTLSSLSDDVRSVMEFHDPSVVADIIRTV